MRSAGAQDGHDGAALAALGNDPGGGELCDADAVCVGERPQPVDQGEVRGEVVGVKAGQPVGAWVASGGLSVGAGEQAVCEDPVSGDADPQLAAGVHDAVYLGATAEQGVFDLYVADRVHGVGAADGLRPYLGQPDVADVSGLDQFGDGADRVLDRGVGGEAGGAVDVDMVGPEATQRVGERVFHMGGTALDADEGSVGAAQTAELHAQENLFAIAVVERAADEVLVVAHAVEVGGVEEGDAGSEGRVDRGDGVSFVSGGRPIGHARAAQRERSDLRATGSKGSGLHGSFCGVKKVGEADGGRRGGSHLLLLTSQH
ncbi:hypothetical protein SCOCK_560007 [Actinacidiphila cocklensis]|uniref:Uncharacterized protein n=1 Tax=Actinacidiphila cocklensis TaxID=887465 RepID=A0A9W4GV29_9ACTN|nr:hypothetical protein SCOCK_560007 [Actinacidiphila cocklensis]